MLSSDISVYSKATISQGTLVHHCSVEEESAEALKTSTTHDMEREQQEERDLYSDKNKQLSLVLLKEIVKKVWEYCFQI